MGYESFFFLMVERVTCYKSEWYNRMGKTDDEGQRGYNYLKKNLEWEGWVPGTGIAKVALAINMNISPTAIERRQDIEHLLIPV